MQEAKRVFTAVAGIFRRRPGINHLPTNETYSPSPDPKIESADPDKILLASRILNRLRKKEPVDGLLKMYNQEEITLGLVAIALCDKNYEEIHEVDSREIPVQKQLFINKRWEGFRSRALDAIAQLGTEESAFILFKIARVAATDARPISGNGEALFFAASSDRRVISHLPYYDRYEEFENESTLRATWRPWKQTWMDRKLEQQRYMPVINIERSFSIAPVSTEDLQVKAVQALATMDLQSAQILLRTLAREGYTCLKDYSDPHIMGIDNRTFKVAETAADILVQKGLGDKATLEREREDHFYIDHF